MTDDIAIVRLAAHADLHEPAARILMNAFPRHWTTPDEGLEEVETLCQPEHIALAAVAPSGELLGWIGGLPEYDGNVWELHPLVVRPQSQRQGVGRRLVQALEAEVTRRGGITIMLGTDDEDDQTTLGGVDLYPDPLAHVARIRNLKDHPYTFYQKMGFVIVGIMPDANGFGKPDIYMAKKVNFYDS